ncbi:MAG TPA: nucleotidyltransferase domain-containing protein [Thermodesulfovibrionales bacterium]|nr:nucleotidyltransferase domain-containing protein [Thermodesulfovibrionales bacterium]
MKGNVRMQELRRHRMKELGIIAVYLFGSEAEGTMTTRSDIDIGVVLEEPEDLEDTRPLYNALYAELSRVYKPTFLRDLDIVLLQKAPLTLQYNAITHGKILYEEDPVQRADYEESVTNSYLDFRPVLEYFNGIASRRYTR